MNATTRTKGPRRCRLALTAATGMGLALAWATAAQAAGPYSFVNIADSTGPFSSFVGAPAINDTGTVAFQADLDSPSFGRGIFAGAVGGGPVVTIADDSGPLTTLGLGNPDINAGGTVAFRASFDGGGGAIYAASSAGGGPLTPVIQTASGPTGYGDPAINDAGVVVFKGDLDSAGAGIYAGSAAGGPITPLVNTTSPLSVSSVNPSINDAGVVVFGAVFPPGPSFGLFTIPATGGSTTPVATPGGPLISITPRDPSINDAGTVAFRADSKVLTVSSGGTLTTVVNANAPSPFGPLADFAINDAGVVVFEDIAGIFTGPDIVSDKVIKDGDPLFGSTVLSLDFLHGLNNRGDIAFRYSLLNGVSGIAVAVVPEPSASLSMALAGLALLRRRRRESACA